MRSAGWLAGKCVIEFRVCGYVDTEQATAQGCGHYNPMALRRLQSPVQRWKGGCYIAKRMWGENT